MNERGMTRVSKDQLAEMIDEVDWARVDAMTEADIERAAAEEPVAPMTMPATGRTRESSGR
jgi:hypothetical protein